MAQANRTAKSGTGRNGRPPRSKPGVKRERILEVAIDAFGRYGYEDAKWADVAAAVGIGPTALYHYFESKQHCLYEIMGTAVARLPGALRPHHGCERRLDGSPRRAPRRRVQAHRPRGAAEPRAHGRTGPDRDPPDGAARRGGARDRQNENARSRVCLGHVPRPRHAAGAHPRERPAAPRAGAHSASTTASGTGTGQAARCRSPTSAGSSSAASSRCSAAHPSLRTRSSNFPSRPARASRGTRRRPRPRRSS